MRSPCQQCGYVAKKTPPDVVPLWGDVAMGETDRRRLAAASQRVLRYLQAHGGSATNVELSHPSVGGLRAVGRIWDLQQAGYTVIKSHVKGGVWRYRLPSE